MNKKNELSKAEMKNILGGTVVPPAGGCSVSCSSGLHACCNGKGESSTCTCVVFVSSPYPTCASGGYGSTSCTAAGSDPE